MSLSDKCCKFLVHEFGQMSLSDKCLVTIITILEFRAQNVGVSQFL